MGGALFSNRICVLLCTLAVSAQSFAFVAIHGHRGARSLRPENTTPGLLYAASLGIEVLEFDIVITKDGVPVLSHDPEVNPSICLKADGSKVVEPRPIIFNLTLAELKAYDCGTLKNPRFTSQVPIPRTPKPTLREFFEALKSSSLPNKDTIQFNIETKIFADRPEVTPDPETFAKLVIAELDRAQVVERTILQSFDDRTLEAARRLKPSLRLAVLNYSKFSNSLARAQKLKAEFVSPNTRFVTADYVRRAHSLGMQVVPWTANDPQTWSTLVNAGVDAIISDDPAALLEFLKARGQR
jgi:glycerophosphoryl diester phosphodiesterase